MMDILFLFILGMIPSSTTDSEFGSTDAAVEIVETNAGEEAQDPLVALLSEPEETQTNETDNNSLTDTTMTDVKLLQKGEVLDTEQVAVITTTKGEVVLRFFPEDAPKTVENFTGLAEKGYYDGIIFHRVIDGFMVQGGDPTGTGMGGESLWGGKFEDEFSDDAKNNRGSISMANAGPGTNGSQFFLNTVNNNFLDNRHTVFGEVISGMDNVDAIVSAETDARDKPLSELKMEKVEIMTFAEYKAR